jgi:hypothetical protein
LAAPREAAHRPGIRGRPLRIAVHGKERASSVALQKS